MSNNEELKERAKQWASQQWFAATGRGIINDLLAALEAAELDAECNRIQAVDRGNSFSAMQTENATLKTGCQSFQDSFYRESKKTKQLQQNNATLEAENADLKTRLAGRTCYHDNAAVEAEVKRLESELSRYRTGAEVSGRAFTGAHGSNNVVGLHEMLEPHLGHDVAVLVMADLQEVQD